VLLDSCVAGLAVQVLRDAGHDASWAGDWAHDPGDEEILRRAARPLDALGAEITTRVTKVPALAKSA
jgi:predicted nuclease of predicted toxin-antitoxin system